MKNPYLNRVAIRDINQFYGRRKEIARIFSRLGASRPQSVSIVGERRIGKSSLLNYIYSTIIRSEQLDNATNYIFIFMDLQQKRYETVEAFFADFLELIVQAVAEPLPIRSQDFDGVRKVFAELHRRGRKLIVLLDEFDVITANRAFNLDFFSFLRSAANNYDLAYITSSARELQVLCHADQIADSPFFNIFTNIYLRPFTAEEAGLLITEPSRAVGVPLESHAKAIIDLAGHFPFFLQIACATYVDHLIDGSSWDANQIRESFLDEAGVHFRYIWEHFSTAEREVVDAVINRREIPRMRLHVADELRRNGYLGQDGQLFSSCFAAAIARLGNNTVATPVVKQKPIHFSYRADSFGESGPRLAGFDRDSYLIPPTDPALHPQDLGRRWGQVKPEKLQQILQQGQIGRFELLQLIGEGGMGQVILARDRELTRQVAIKLLKERYASDEQIRRRFLREAQTASILSHPNIATIYEIGEVNGIPYIVMEYVRGRTLASLARKRPLPVAEIVQIGLQVAQALAEAHQAGIVHRDIKSSNILLSERGQIKVLDFGLAKAWSLAQPVAAATITEPGMLMGTVTYMSPEQAAGKDALDHRTDIFSLGVVMYEISTGQLPFDGSTYLEIIEAITKQDPPAPHLVWPEIPLRLSQVIMQMLAKRCEDRFATAEEVIQSLQSVEFP
jgi:eukaryotic-like serine/threonine-protein kinase